MKDKTSLYILSIIGIVAIVGVLSLLISSGSSSNIIGQAIRTNVICGDGICQPSFENKSNCPADCTGKKSTGIDTDSDGTLDVRDTDDDNDGYSDTDEAVAGTDPLDATDVPLPDLIISAVVVSAYYNNYSDSYVGDPTPMDTLELSVIIENQGTASAGSYHSFLVVVEYTLSDGSTGSVTGYDWFSSLASGASSTRTVLIDISPNVAADIETVGAVTADIETVGAVTLETVATADSSSRITESDETNNEYTTTLSVDSSHMVR